MPATAVLDATGISVPDYEDIREALQDDLRGQPDWGDGAQVESGGVVGQIIDVVSDTAAQLFDLLLGLWDAGDPDAAEGVALEILCSINGIFRRPATFTQVGLRPTGTPSTPIPAGTRYRQPDGAIVATLEAVTVGPGGTVDVAASPDTAGPIEIAGGTVTEIVDPIAGITAVTNPERGFTGLALETDAELRERRAREVAARGSAREFAIRGAVEELGFITGAAVVANSSCQDDTTYTPALPGGAVRVYVLPDPLTANQQDEVARQIWNTIGATQSVSGAPDPLGFERTFTDDQGYEQTIGVAYGVRVLLQIEIDVQTLDDYPADGTDLIEALVLAYGDALRLGEPAQPIRIAQRILDGDAVRSGVPGVYHLTIGLRRFLSLPFVELPIAPLGPHEQLYLDDIASGNMTITETPAP